MEISCINSYIFVCLVFYSLRIGMSFLCYVCNCLMPQAYYVNITIKIIYDITAICFPYEILKIYRIWYLHMGYTEQDPHIYAKNQIWAVPNITKRKTYGQRYLMRIGQCSFRETHFKAELSRCLYLYKFNTIRNTDTAQQFFFT